jgi:hypothetical protein
MSAPQRGVFPVLKMRVSRCRPQFDRNLKRLSVSRLKNSYVGAYRNLANANKIPTELYIINYFELFQTFASEFHFSLKNGRKFLRNV